MADRPVLCVLSRLLCSLAWLSGLLLFTVFIIAREVAISVSDPEILIILNILRPMA